MALSERLKNKRKEARLSQEGLAKKIDTSMSTLRRWENEERLPDVNDLLKLAAALNTTVAYLTGETNDPQRRTPETQAVNVSGDVSGNGNTIANNIVTANRAPVVIRNGHESSLSDDASELLRLYEGFDVRRRMELLGKAFAIEEDARVLKVDGK